MTAWVWLLRAGHELFEWYQLKNNDVCSLRCCKHACDPVAVSQNAISMHSDVPSPTATLSYALYALRTGLRHLNTVPLGCYLLLYCLFSSLCDFCRSIQITQICLPSNCHATGEYTSVLRFYKREAECCNCRPKFNAVYQRCRHCTSYALPNLWEGIPGKQGLHAKEIGVEDRREGDLIDDHFCSKGEDLRRIVKIVVEEHEPERRLISYLIHQKR